jgi:hypothetical protein
MWFAWRCRRLCEYCCAVVRSLRVSLKPPRRPETPFLEHILTINTLHEHRDHSLEHGAPQPHVVVRHERAWLGFARRHREACTTLTSATFKYCATTGCCGALQKPMGACSFSLFRLVCLRHGTNYTPKQKTEKGSACFWYEFRVAMLCSHFFHTLCTVPGFLTLLR